jgi:low affinity Fe/Cu permease
MSKQNVFNRLSLAAARATGAPTTFLVAVLVVVGWAASGPLFGFGDTWQLVINTGTTIVTFLMVFLIQSTQNRDTKAMQIKLDELILVMEKANDCLLDLEQLDEDDLDSIRKTYLHRAKAARDALCKDRANAPAAGDVAAEHGVTDVEVATDETTRAPP